MSATLTWYHSGNGTKTGTAIGNLFSDLKTLIDSKSADANYKWEVAGSNIGSTPYYILLRRKDLSAGRILLVAWSSAPAGNNSAILEAAPTTQHLFAAWFPAGTANTASNLTAASGTIAGDDTGCVKVSAAMSIATIYGASVVPFYFDSAEAVAFGFQNPATASMYFVSAGDILVDTGDNAVGGVFGFGGTSVSNWSSASQSMAAWSTTPQTAGTSTTPHIRSNFGASNTIYWQAWRPSGNQFEQSFGAANSMLIDTSNTKAYFVPVPLMCATIKGQGFALKLRQMAYGPGTTGAFEPYNTTGPVVQARQFANGTTGSNSAPWFTNFKL